jgi:hypothetical protein
MEMEPDTIFETDVLQLQYPHNEVDEMEAEDFGRVAQCCRTIPCSNPTECPR